MSPATAGSHQDLSLAQYSCIVLYFLKSEGVNLRWVAVLYLITAGDHVYAHTHRTLGYTHMYMQLHIK